MFSELPGALPPKPFGARSIGLLITPIELSGDHRSDLIIAYTKGDPFYVGRWLQVLVNDRAIDLMVDIESYDVSDQLTR